MTTRHAGWNPSRKLIGIVLQFRELGLGNTDVVRPGGRAKTEPKEDQNQKQPAADQSAASISTS
jgi:hypothetical protein